MKPDFSNSAAYVTDCRCFYPLWLCQQFFTIRPYYKSNV